LKLDVQVQFDTRMMIMYFMLIYLNDLLSKSFLAQLAELFI